MTENPRWWQWPTILSLDAPLVALLWQWQLARAAGAAIRPEHASILGISVWLAYAADRWIEGLRLRPGQALTQRHRFYQVQRWPVAAAWVAALAADLWLAAHRLSIRELKAGSALLVPVGAYLLSHQHYHRMNPWRVPKEVCVALLLGAGASLFVALSPGADLGKLALPLSLFVLLCFANCALISVWERTVDQGHGQTSIAVQFRRGAAMSRVLPWLLAGAGAGLGIGAAGPVRAAGLCAGASGLLLAALDRIEPRVGWRMARALADFALATPAVPLIAGLLARP